MECVTLDSEDGHFSGGGLDCLRVGACTGLMAHRQAGPGRCGSDQFDGRLVAGEEFASRGPGDVAEQPVLEHRIKSGASPAFRPVIVDRLVAQCGVPDTFRLVLRMACNQASKIYHGEGREPRRATEKGNKALRAVYDLTQVRSAKIPTAP
jgi:hypothetical protein